MLTVRGVLAHSRSHSEQHGGMAAPFLARPHGCGGEVAALTDFGESFGRARGHDKGDSSEGAVALCADRVLRGRSGPDGHGCRGARLRHRQRRPEHLRRPDRYKVAARGYGSKEDLHHQADPFRRLHVGGGQKRGGTRRRRIAVEPRRPSRADPELAAISQLPAVPAPNSTSMPSPAAHHAISEMMSYVKKS